MSQARYWLLTIPHQSFTPFLHADRVGYIKGQLERGTEGGYLHWQLLVVFKRAVRLAAVKSIYGVGIHAEPSRSAAASDYVWKEDTRVAGTQFELGKVPFKRNDPKDWESIWEDAKHGRLESIPGDVRIRCYNQLRRIATDNLQAVGLERQVVCYWGRTGTGKSRRAWDEAGLLAYPKDPRTKFWDGYRGQEHVVVDEFRGGIDISHLLRWCDRYPVLVEVKGSSVALSCRKIWITSNLHPRDWYPDLDEETKAALLRRLEITHFEINVF